MASVNPSFCVIHRGEPALLAVDVKNYVTRCEHIQHITIQSACVRPVSRGFSIDHKYRPSKSPLLIEFMRYSDSEFAPQ